MKRAMSVGLLMVALCAHATEVPPAAPPSPAKTVPASPDVTVAQPKTFSEFDYLGGQLSAERRHNDQILQTVYWALGVISTLTFALIGFGWFANFKLYERDKEAMRRELLAEISTERSRLEEKFTERIGEISRRSSETLDKMKADLQGNVTGLMEKSVSSLRARINSEVGHRKALEIDFHRHRAKLSAREKDLSGVITRLRDALGVAMSVDGSPSIPYIINQLEEALDIGGEIPRMFQQDMLLAIEKLTTEIPAAQKARLIARLQAHPAV